MTGIHLRERIMEGRADEQVIFNGYRKGVLSGK